MEHPAGQSATAGLECGLRARKKLATWEAISSAALHLALERGPENVRVEDIAAAAGVSPRTYNNYFSSREEAICAHGVRRHERMAAALHARPPEEGLGESLTHAMLAPFMDGAEPDKQVVRMMLSCPALRGEFLKAAVAGEAALAQEIAARTGADPERDLAPRLLAATVVAASRAAMLTWLNSGPEVRLTHLIRQAAHWIAGRAPDPIGGLIR